jgi:hypothetical protein
MPYGSNPHRIFIARNIGECRAENGASKMVDFVLLALGMALFAASFAYAYACDRL